MDIRKITPEESKEYHRLSQYAFGNWQDKEVEDDKIKWMNPDDCFVAIEDGEMVSGLISHGLKQSVRGVVKKLSGIGNVATFPEYRNKGYVKELFEYAFLDMNAKEIAVSMLQPFKESFYQKFGYVSTNREINLKFQVAGIQHYLAKITDGWQVERKTGLEAQQEFNAFLAKEASAWHGMVISDDIYQGFQEHLARNTIYIIVKHNNEIKAACSYKKKDMTIRMDNVLWTDIQSRKVLFNYFARHRDQVGDFEMFIPMGTNFYNWFSDMRNQYELKMCEGPWMVRIVDVLSAFQDIPVSSTGSFIMEVRDEMCTWNNGKYALKAKNGSLDISQCDDSVEADLSGDIKGITALLYGSANLSEIIDKGWLEVADLSTINVLQDWFPEQILFNTFFF
jgi:predicted acetyltransferase